MLLRQLRGFLFLAELELRHAEKASISPSFGRRGERPHRGRLHSAILPA